MTQINENIAKKAKNNKKIKNKENNICKYCNCNNQLIMTIDHRIPRIRGGEDTNKNKDCVCYICNQLKGGLTDKEFKRYLKALLILKDLEKIRIEIAQPRIIFNQHHYPDFGMLVKDIKKKEEEVKK